MSDLVCEHGSLRRKCEICERDERIKELEARVEGLEEEATRRRLDYCQVVSENIGHRGRITKLEELLRRAYNEAMDHDVDSRELDEKIRLILQERVLLGEE